MAKRGWFDDDDGSSMDGTSSDGTSSDGALGDGATSSDATTTESTLVAEPTLVDVVNYPRLEPAVKRFQTSPAAVGVSAVTLICVVAGVVVLARIGVMPPWLLTLVVSLDLIVALGVVAVLSALWSNPRQVRFWVVTLVAVALMVGNGVVVKVGTDYLRFGDRIQAGATDMVVYDIVVRDDGPTEVSQLAGTLMGEDRDDPLIQAVHSAIDELVKLDFLPVAPWTQMIADVIDEKVTSIVIDDALMQILSEADPATYEQLRILISFEVPDESAKPTPSPTPPPPPGSAYMVYISGIDTYGKISTRARSDVNILMTINPVTGKVLLVNTPRDFYVPLRGKTGYKDKLTHAGVYGIDVSVGTIEDLYDVKIDYYLRINFSSLITVVDAVGGIDVYSEYAFSAGGYTFVKGQNHMDGKAALAFSRERHSFATGDRVRGQNQQRVIEGIIHRLSSPSVLMSYTSVLAAVESSIQTSMPLDVMSSLVKRQLQTGQSWDVESISVNGSDASEYTYSYPGQRLYVMMPDQATVKTAQEKIQAVQNG